MKDEIMNKMDEHVKHLMEKPFLSNEDYAVLDRHAEKIPEPKFLPDPFLIFLMFMIFSIGGHNHE